MLSDNETIKALECCCKNNNCEGCPLDCLTFSSQCASELAIKSLDLINRLEADLIDKEKQLQDALKSMAVNKTKVIDCEKEINRLQAENERLTKCRKEEVEKLVTATDKVISETKSEAYKEFAQEYKEQIKNYTGMFTDYGFMVNLEAILSAVDFIEHKLVGEDNG